MSTVKIVSCLKESDQDFEWYPTTDKMIDRIKQHMTKIGYQSRDDESGTYADILDCGAGDGRVLEKLAGCGDKYAIEKSSILVSQQPADIVPVGTDFHQSTLIDKKVDIVFSNPPYSEYEQWASKIIKEANAPDVYLIIPGRWKDSETIKHALESRGAEAKTLHSTDFLNADRAARAKVNILHIDLRGKYGYRKNHRHYNDTSEAGTDPFSIWFDETFPQSEKTSSAERTKDGIQKDLDNEMIAGRNLIESLVYLYQSDMQNISNSYQAACQLDPSVVAELEILIDSRSSLVSTLKKALKQRIQGLKHLYWHEFFSNYESITDRLTTGSRERMLSKLHHNINVDFTADNAYAITLWVIRNANKYYDQQLIDLVERMTRQANVAMYKSNQRTYGKEDWRFSRYAPEKAPEGLSHYKLELRIVLESMGGIYNDDFNSWEYPNGLNERSHSFISDIIAVAKTLGWTTSDSGKMRGHTQREWESNKSQQFICSNGEMLMDVKAFKNGNLHIKFNQKFMRKLNVEFGRLKGWIKDHTQAAHEMNIPEEEAQDYFNGIELISGVSPRLLLAHRGADAFDDNAAPELAKAGKENESEAQLALI